MRKSFQKWWVIALLAAVITTSFQFRENYFEISKNLEIFTTLYRELQLYYVDETNPGELMKTGIDAMLESLDPYTSYIAESDMEDYRFITTGQYGGIGSLIRSMNGQVYISEPYENSPAQKAGLMAGDRLLSIDGIQLSDKDQEEVSKILKGQAGTTITVVVDRQGTQVIATVKREEIKIPDVPYYGILKDNIGYIRLTSFTQTASKEVRDAYYDLKKNHSMEKLVLSSNFCYSVRMA
jgi:carboxyl-terminal processing protease